MAIQIQLRQGTTTEHNTFTGAVGEVTVDTTNKTLRVHDGSTVGGTRLATLTGGLVPTTQLPAATTSVQGAVILNNTLTSTNTNQALTAAQGKVLKDTLDTAFGIGQSYVDLIGSRAFNTTYTNSAPRTIFIIFTTTYDSGNTGCLIYVNGSLVCPIQNDGDGSVNVWVTFPVPAGATYRVECTRAMQSWWEVR